jgi:hypothetical protein
MLRSTAGFAIGAAASASLGGCALVLAVPNLAASAWGWAAAAFLVTACPGIVFGVLLEHLHGRQGGAFPLAVGAGLLVRLGLAGLVTVLAAREGGSAIPADLLGLATGFVPVTAFETWWFARKTMEHRG